MVDLHEVGGEEGGDGDITVVCFDEVGEIVLACPFNLS